MHFILPGPRGMIFRIGFSIISQLQRNQFRNPRGETIWEFKDIRAYQKVLQCLGFKTGQGTKDYYKNYELCRLKVYWFTAIQDSMLLNDYSIDDAVHDLFLRQEKWPLEHEIQLSPDRLRAIYFEVKAKLDSELKSSTKWFKENFTQAGEY